MPCFLFLLFRLPAVWPGCPVSHTAEDVPTESTEGGTNQLMKMPWAFQSISLAWRGAGPRVLSLPTTTQVAINGTTGTLLTTPDAGVTQAALIQHRFSQNPPQIVHTQVSQRPRPSQAINSSHFMGISGKTTSQEQSGPGKA